MLEQCEGSHAVAAAVALSRPEVICAYPISPQTHIVEGLGEMVKSGALSRCEFINVESEFAAMSVAIGASAAGARAYTATASQGLLFMAEAVYNASGLGLPIVMTVANRAIGAPINIWNDHTDSMSMRDAGWLQLFAETNQEALDLHIQAFRIAEELSLPVMVCMDGFILTHAYERVDMPDQAQVDRFLPPYEPRQVLDPDEPVTIGAMVGPEAFAEVRYLAHAKQMQALDLIPQVADEFRQIFGRDSGGLVKPYRLEDAETIVIALGSVLGTIKDTVDELRSEGVKIGVLGITSFRPFPISDIRDATAHAKRIVVIEKCFAVGIGGIVSRDVRSAVRNRPQPVLTVVAGLGGRAITKASLTKLLNDAIADKLELLTFLDLDWDIVNRVLEREKKQRRSGPLPKTSCATWAPRRLAPEADWQTIRTDIMEHTVVKFYQTGTFTVGNRLLAPDQRSVQANTQRNNSLNSGHRACQGCGEALGARYAIDAAMQATNGQLIAANATGCLEVFSTPYPETSWQMPWIHSLFGNTAAVATGIAAAMRVKGRDQVRVVAQGGDGGTTDIGFGCLSGMFERNDDVLYICYDNEAYMNTGVQRSSATPPAARTATTMPVGPNPGNVFGQGKNLARIAMAHEIPYVATATVADLRDLEYKVTKAMSIRGARYIHIFVPCPLGWGAASHDTIRLARLAHESGVFPVFEAERGEVTGVSKIRRRVPVEDYLRPQKRFAHLFGSTPDTATLARLQAMADRNIQRYGLLDEEA
jgi:pyruvate ferredoxin oxidoreductase alpha subunit